MEGTQSRGYPTELEALKGWIEVCASEMEEINERVIREKRAYRKDENARYEELEGLLNSHLKRKKQLETKTGGFWATRADDDFGINRTNRMERRPMEDNWRTADDVIAALTGVQRRRSRLELTPEQRMVMNKMLGPEAPKYSGDELRMLERRDLTAGSLIEGGSAVPDFWENTLIQDRDRKCQMRNLARVISFKGGNLKAPRLANDPASPTWTSELNIGTEDNTMSLEGRQLLPSPVAKWIRYSNDLAVMSAIPIEELCRERLSHKLATTEESAFLLGHGANQPLGVFVASESGLPTSRDVSTANTTTEIKADNLIEAYYTLESQHLENATWLMHPYVLKAIRRLKDSNGNYLWQPGLTRGAPNTLLDRPIALSMFAPSTFSSGAYLYVFGDFQAGYWIAEQLPLTISVLRELWAATNQTGVVIRARVDGSVVNPNCFVRGKLN